jgi:hypothetical protein
MDIYSVTPQMERHMGYVESFGSSKPIMHSYEEDEMANKYLEGAVEDIDDSFVYGELEDNDDEPKSEGNVDEDLLQMALDDIAKKLSTKPEARKIPKEPSKVVVSKKAVIVIKKEIKKVEVKHILKEKGYGGVLQGIF